MSATVKYAFRESRAGVGAPKRLRVGSAARPSSEPVPRVARLLALANKFRGMLDRGEVESMAELARLGRVSRARITQDLLILAPDIQEEVLCDGTQLTLRGLLRLARAAQWEEQRCFWVFCRAPKAAA